MSIVPLRGSEGRHSQAFKTQAGERRIVRRAVGSFTARQKLAFALYHCEGLTVPAIALVMRTSPQAVRNLLSNGRMEVVRALACGRRRDSAETCPDEI